MALSPDLGRLREKIGARTAAVTVVGLGYVGLPLAVTIARAGFQTTGIDTDEGKVRKLRDGQSYVPDVPASDVRRQLSSGRLRFASTFDPASLADVAVIAVPTPTDAFRTPDLSHVSAAAAALASVMRPPSLVVLESTTYPGATEELIGAAFRERGLVVGTDICLGFSPERIDPGNETWNLTNTPKIVAGLTPNCLELVASFYGAFVDRLVRISDLKTAEAAKLFENTFRFVNIALVNEFQKICDAFGIDVWEALDACNTKPYGFMRFQPGPGLGGHCIPVDPFYLAWKARAQHVNTEFIELAGRINAAMPDYVVGKVAAALNDRGRPLRGSRVAVLGAAYKRNSPDIRESPAIRIVELLQTAGARVTYHDPHVPGLVVAGTPLSSQPLTVEYLSAQDCSVIVTDHDVIDWTLVMRYSAALVDTRNVRNRHLALRLAEELETA